MVMTREPLGNTTGKSAYDQAVAAGYTGSETEFMSLLALVPNQLVSGTVDEAGHLLMQTADGETVDLGVVKGEPGQDGSNVLPTNQAIADAVTTDGPAKDALENTFVPVVTAAKSPDLLITGAITRNGDGVITSAAVVWPDGKPGTFTTDAIDASGAINGYHVTHVDGSTTKTYTQPTITRDSSGAATNVPQIVVS